MNKKIFIGFLFFISLLVLAGGCGGGHSGSIAGSTDLQGAWTSSSNGTATIAGTNDDSDELEKFSAFGEIPDDVLKQYQEKKAKETAKTITAPVTRAMALFEDCNISGNSGTVKFTAIIIVSNDSVYLPIFFNGVKLSMQNAGSNSWTAITPDNGTLSISMASNEKINLSGKVKYLDDDCEFSTVINKSTANPINAETILDGTWSLDGTQSGGYIADNSKKISAALVPEAASVSFSNISASTSEAKTSAATSPNMAFSLISQVKSSASANDILSLFQSVNPAVDVTLSKVYDNVYKLKDKKGNENIVFVENIDEIFVIKSESEDNTLEASVFLPLKKINFNLETVLNKNWTASEGNGGGWIHFDDITSLMTTNDPMELEFLKVLEDISFTLKNAALNFSGITANDDGTITATMNINASLPVTTELLKTLLPANEQVFNVNESGTVTMIKSGNSCQFENGGDIYKLTFISDNELILSVESSSEGEGYGEFIMRLNAN